MSQDEQDAKTHGPGDDPSPGLRSAAPSGVRLPPWADRLLEWFCAPHLLEEVQGDLHERFCRRAQRFGAAYARRQYGREVLGFLRPAFLKRRPRSFAKPLPTGMFRSYLTIALRSAARSKGSSFTNIAGLSVGMACCMLLLYIADELGYDRFHQKQGQLYRVWQNQRGENGQVSTNLITPVLWRNQSAYGTGADGSTYGGDTGTAIRPAVRIRTVLAAGEHRAVCISRLAFP